MAAFLFGCLGAGNLALFVLCVCSVLLQLFHTGGVGVGQERFDLRGFYHTSKNY